MGLPVRFMVTCCCINNLFINRFSVWDGTVRFLLAIGFLCCVFFFFFFFKRQTSKLAAVSEDFFNIAYLIMIKQPGVYSICFDLDVSSAGQGYK